MNPVSESHEVEIAPRQLNELVQRVRGVSAGYDHRQVGEDSTEGSSEPRQTVRSTQRREVDRVDTRKGERHELAQTDDDGRPLFLIRKERQHSPNKIDLAMCGVLSWEAAKDAITEGAVSEGGPSIYETEELLVL